MKYILFNSKSKNGSSNEVIDQLVKKLGDDVVKCDVLSIDKQELVNRLNSNDELNIVGGDGTLNHFVNDVDTDNLPCDTYFVASGTGNDFQNDMKDYIVDGRIKINEVVKNLPVVTIKGKDYKFINGVGYGIDGYCCQEGDRLQALSDKPVNYTSIAIKGLLFKYKAPNAVVTVDGVSKEYKRTWLAPTMKGKYYGGGMIVAPNQNRFDENRTLTNVVMHKSGKIKTLMVFPGIFKGEHVKHTEMVEVRTGKEFHVKFDIPTALQIDGETILDVLEYSVHI